MKPCSRGTCYAPESTCDLGHLEIRLCPAWKNEDGTTLISRENSAAEFLLPWSGCALGLVDLGFIAGRSKPFVVGIVGPQNAGKTTLLAAWYLLVGRGLTGSQNRRFAGSYSLAGWEAVSSALRWAPGRQPNFPPHTSSHGERAPGLLHLAFRESEEDTRSYLFADAPGEWFQKWAVNRDSPNGEGARWVAEYADVFLLIADRKALSGPGLGQARNAIQILARRLAAERAGRPVALVWTKADVALAPEIEKTVRQAVFSVMPDLAEFSVSILPAAQNTTDTGQGLLALFDWILSLRRQQVSLPPLVATSADPLFLFGTRV